MNRIIIICAYCLFSFLTVVNANAAGSVQAYGSWWDSGDADTSFGGGLRGTMGDEIALDLGWTYFAGDDISIGAYSGGVNSNAIDLGLRYTFPMEIYLGGGGSYYFMDSDIGSTDGTWGLYGLVGWSFGGENIRGFVEGIYRYADTSIDFDRPVNGSYSYDISYDGFGANIGIMFRF